MRIKILAFLVLSLLLFGCSQGQEPNYGSGQENGLPEPANNENPSLNAPFYESFSQEKFEQAKSDGKTILLEFYANWCPICRAQKPHIEQAFSELTNPEIVGFQVNYKDDETDNFETGLARKFGVTYQHTHVIIDSQENVLLKEIATQWDKETVIEKLSEAGE